ncbi:calcium-binding protein [Aquincola sp. S2]|uniref:Calcium-binding protein n=1 Tax=Pseudaquabacterium terrae TaxID=2732868 RepID=A0ABX2ENF3_9BURK|nr:calcium-binding protein [Aquabacterium terrae]NRF70176.1 calcium-binding protein [Aquabacterium terrae]
MAFHLYDITELFSNANGSVQFIELRTGANGESFWSGQTITVTQGASVHTFTFPGNLPSTQTANTSVLLATQGFANLGIVTPNFIIPDGFLFTGGSATVNFGGSSDVVSYATLPTDGQHSIDRNGAQQINSPTNFAGQTGSVNVGGGLNPIVGTANADTLNGTAGADDIDGLAGRDSLKGNGGDDVLDGGSEVDTALYSGNRATYTVGAAGGSVSGGGEGSDMLTSIERVRFADFALAFDFGANGAASNSAKLLNAVFGDAGLHNRTYAGIGLSLFDGGQTYTQVADLAIHAALGQQIDNAALVRLLYTNVVGAAPSEQEVTSFVALITSGAFTQTSLTTFAADHELNAARINLTGLAQGGLEFTPSPG